MGDIQDKIKAKLSTCGLPFKKIDVYGSQIVVTAWSSKAAMKWETLITTFATLRGTTHSFDYAKENKNTVLLPSKVEVWRVFARV